MDHGSFNVFPSINGLILTTLSVIDAYLPDVISIHQWSDFNFILNITLYCPTFPSINGLILTRLALVQKIFGREFPSINGLILTQIKQIKQLKRLKRISIHQWSDFNKIVR